MKRIIRSVAMAMRNSIQIRWALFETHERKLMETAGPDLEETAEAAVSQEVGVLAERGGVEEAVGGKERKGSQEKVDDVMDEREVETVRAEVPSVVDTAAPTDAVKEEGSPTAHHPLSLTWCFGFTHTLPVHNVSNNSRKMVFYASSHTGVLYDCESSQQCLLQGHGNPITCTAVSGDRRWIATADEGEDPLITVWDSFSGVPVRTFFEGLGSGCTAVGLSHDALYLATLSSQSPQMVSMWQWTVDSAQPMCHALLDDHTHLSSLTFHPTDHSQLVTTGESQVAFFTWDGKKLHSSSNQITDKDFNKPVGVFSKSVFIPDSEQLALTGTSLGHGVVWGPLKKGSMVRKSLKLMKLHDDPITAMTTTGDLVVMGDSTGRVKFFSSELKLLHWYDGMLGLGPSVSISFAHTTPVKVLLENNTGRGREAAGVHYPPQSTLEAPPLVVPDFTLSCLSSRVAHVTSNGTVTDVLFRGHDSAVHGLATHPSLPRIAVAGYSTLLQLWDYEKKEVLVSREFEEPNYIQCVSFDPQGDFIGVGFTSGVVVVVDSLTLHDASPLFRFSRHSVSHLSFSHNSHYMATADLDHCVTVYTKQVVMVEGGEGEGGGEEEEEGGEGGSEVEVVEEVTWKFLAKYRSHYETIESVLFGVNLDSDSPRLLSLGQDRMLIEYDLEHSTTDNLCIQSSDRIEQSAVPASLTWYPPTISKESFLLLCNSQYKLKLLNSTTKMCRKTLLGPTFGTPLRKLEVLSSPLPESEAGQGTHRYAAFHTSDRVGLLLLPHDGNPHNSQSLIAHPTGVSEMTVSHDGRFVFTAGGQDCTVNMWTTNTLALEAASHLGGEDLEPFYALLEGGRYGEFYAEMEDYFYYAQIKSQGVKTRDTRQVLTTVPVGEISDLMRALGFYPSEQDIEDMLNEVKFSNYVETGAYVTEVNLPTFIRLYINHRPAFGLSPVDLLQAFSALGVEGEGQGCTVDRGTLLALLQENGEHMTETEVVECLMTLLGHCEDPERDGAFSQSPQTALEQGLPESISTAHFAENILQLTMQSSSAAAETS